MASTFIPDKLIFFTIVFIIITTNVQSICSTIPVITGSEIDDSDLDSSCFVMDMTLMVENILPDPSYILPESNWAVINEALKKTLNDKDITEFTITNGISSDNKNWYIDNKACPDTIDNTVQKFQFEALPYNILCNNNTLKINPEKQTIECTFIMPNTSVYIWDLLFVESIIGIKNIEQCGTATLQAIVGKLIKEEESWKVIAVSNELQVTPETVNDIQQFIFNTSPPARLFSENTIYSLVINVKKCVSVISVKSNPVMLTHQQPHPCELGNALTNRREMNFGLRALCDRRNLRDEEIRLHFEDIFYQQHSSQNIIEKPLLGPPKNTFSFAATIPSVARRLEDDDRDDTSPTCGSCSTPTPSPARRLIQYESVITNSVHDVRRNLLDAHEPGFYETRGNGTGDRLAEYIDFPCVSQCIAIDSSTNRIFSVGGQINGHA
eukprot:52871_1